MLCRDVAESAIVADLVLGAEGAANGDLFSFDFGLSGALDCSAAAGAAGAGSPVKEDARFRFLESPLCGFWESRTLPASTSSSAIRWRGHKWP